MVLERASLTLRLDFATLSAIRSLFIDLFEGFLHPTILQIFSSDTCDTSSTIPVIRYYNYNVLISDIHILWRKDAAFRKIKEY
jgi:hypothetical protein